MDSSTDTLTGGFPHSEISGSKLVCQLPGAFRRLPRLSSPVVAKASTVCAYSLDPITPKPRSYKTFATITTPSQRISLLCAAYYFALPKLLKSNSNYTVLLNRSIDINRYLKTPPPAAIQRGLIFLGILFSHLPLQVYQWWSQAGLNRRPPACKAGALPSELWPQAGGSGWTRTIDLTLIRGAL